MKKKGITKTWLVSGIVLIVTCLFIAADAQEQGVIKDAMMKMKGRKCTMKDMQKCTMKCMANCEKNIQDISMVTALLDDAVKSIDAGNTDDAKMKIGEAKKILSDMHIAQKSCMDKMPVVNSNCPIERNEIDMMNTPPNLTRMYKGQKIGFCCAACPAKWDKLPDEKKNLMLKEWLPVETPQIPEIPKKLEIPEIPEMPEKPEVPKIPEDIEKIKESIDNM